MNQGHAASVRSLCAHVHADDCPYAQTLTVDPEGFHVRTQRGIHYLQFAEVCASTDVVRREMIRLVQQAA